MVESSASSGGYLCTHAHEEDESAEIVRRIYERLDGRAVPKELRGGKIEEKFGEICRRNNGKFLREFMVSAGEGGRVFHGLVNGVFVFVRWCADVGVKEKLDAVVIIKSSNGGKSFGEILVLEYVFASLS